MHLPFRPTLPRLTARDKPPPKKSEEASNDIPLQRQQHSRHTGMCINTCQAYNTSYSSIIPGITGPRGTTRWWNQTAPKKRWKKVLHTQKKQRALWGSNNQLETLTEWKLPVQPLCFFHDTCEIDTYLYVRIDSRDSTKKRKQHPSTGDDASMAEDASGRVGRDEQGEARRANTTPNGGPHLELRRLRLKNWSKSDFSIAETWPTYNIYSPQSIYKHIFTRGASPRRDDARHGSAHARNYRAVGKSRP